MCTVYEGRPAVTPGTGVEIPSDERTRPSSWDAPARPVRMRPSVAIDGRVAANAVPSEASYMSAWVPLTTSCVSPWSVWNSIRRRPFAYHRRPLAPVRSGSGLPPALAWGMSDVAGTSELA